MYDVSYSYEDKGNVYNSILTSHWRGLQVNTEYIKKWRIKEKQIFLEINNIKKRIEK